MAHRKTVRHFHEPGHLHELTFSCYRRMPLLTNDSWREKLARCVDAADNEAAIELRRVCFHARARASACVSLNSPPRQQHPGLPMIHGLPEGAIR